MKRRANELKVEANKAKLQHAVLHEGLARLKEEEHVAAATAAVGNRAASLHHITAAATGAALPHEAHDAMVYSFTPRNAEDTARRSGSGSGSGSANGCGNSTDKVPGPPAVKHYKGWLTKRAVLSGRNWKRRYFVLSVPKRTLAYYDSEKTESPKRVFLLGSDCSAEAVVRTGAHASFKSNCLKLTTHNSSMYAAANSAAERDLWIDAINRVADMAATAAVVEAAAAAARDDERRKLGRKSRHKSGSSSRGKKSSGSSSSRRRERATTAQRENENPHEHEQNLFDMGREHLERGF